MAKTGKMKAWIPITIGGAILVAGFCVWYFVLREKPEDSE